MRECVSSRQRFQSNCLANAALRGECVASLFRAFSLSFSLPSLLLSLAHSRSRAPGSRPGRDRFERSRRPSSARPRPDTASASHSLSLNLSSLSAPYRSSYPLSHSFSHSLSLSLAPLASSIHPRIYTFPLPHIMSYPAHSPSVSYDSVVSIERVFHESSRPSLTAQTQRETNAARASRQRDYRRELSRDSYLYRLWHTSLNAPLSSRSTAFAAPPLAITFFRERIIPRISCCLSLTLS